MRIGLIVGSHRPQSQSAKIGERITEFLREFAPNASVYTLDLTKTKFPMWDEGVWDGAPEWKKIWDPVSAELKSCDGFVVVSPEYSGMVPAALKNFFLLAGKDEIGHKPGLIVAVSSGRGGSYPVVELRMSSYKNTRINWIPEHMIVRNAENVLNQRESNSDEDSFCRARLTYCLRVLVEYAKALRQVRSSGVLDYANHPNGL
jgi:NAD(P)H-dependent FMN reductase